MSKNIVLTEAQLESLGWNLIEVKHTLKMYQHMNNALSWIRTQDKQTFYMLTNDLLATQYEQLDNVINELDNMAFALMNSTKADELANMKL